MSAELHRRASEMFVRLRALPAARRAAALRESCGGDESLRREVESLLAYDGDDRFLAAQTYRSTVLQAAERGAEIGWRVKDFEILDRIGEGGMGVVYRARQGFPKRVVALKMLRSVLPSEHARRRFEREADLLGRLQHPGVAQIYEAGAADGQPYFAMELIAGQSITVHADRQALTADERLMLLANVCDAVQHAHQRGVIHRDLKPANILVMEETPSRDAVGGAPIEAPPPDAPRRQVRAQRSAIPKVLDFGVARAMDAQDPTRAATQSGQLVGTPRYMAPEQFLGEPDAVDARCDVYALGVIGYELLAGRPPLDFEGLSLAAAIERARNDEPPRLGGLRPQYRGDVETIIATALAKDPERRYASVGQFAEDIRRHLRDEPVFARPATFTYQLRKFARRRRGLVTAAGIALAAVLAGGAVSTWAWIQSMRANAALVEEQSRTREEEKKSRLAFDFMRRTLTSVDPERDGREVRLVDVLDAASGEIAATFEGRPDIEAHVRYTFGRIYQSLGQLAASRREYERVDALARQKGMSRLDALQQLAEVLKDAADGHGAANAAHELLAVAGDANPAHRRAALNLLGQAYFVIGDLETAEHWVREAVAANASHPVNLAANYANLAAILRRRGRLNEAAECHERGLGLMEQYRGAEEDDTLTAKSNYAQFLKLRGDRERAEAMMRGVLEARERRYGRDHPGTLMTIAALGALYGEWTGRFEEGEALLLEALDGYERLHGPKHRHAMTIRGNLGASYMKQRRFERAESMFQRVLEYERSVHGERDQRTLMAMNNLARAIHQVGRLDDSNALYTELIASAAGALSDEHYELALYRTGWAMTLLDLGRYDDAESQLLLAQVVLHRQFGPEHHYSRRAAETLAHVNEARGRRPSP